MFVACFVVNDVAVIAVVVLVVNDVVVMAVVDVVAWL